MEERTEIALRILEAKIRQQASDHIVKVDNEALARKAVQTADHLIHTLKYGIPAL